MLVGNRTEVRDRSPRRAYYQRNRPGGGITNGRSLGWGGRVGVPRGATVEFMTDRVSGIPERYRPTARMRAAANAINRRVEGAAGGTNPSQKAYRNSARYRERHGLGA